jgi:hypothetical protein
MYKSNIQNIHGRINRRANQQNYQIAYGLFKPKKGLFHYSMNLNDDAPIYEDLRFYSFKRRNNKIFYN